MSRNNDKNKNKIACLDLDAIFNFIFSPDEQRSVDVDLEERYIPVEDEHSDVTTMSLIEKVRRENKTGEHEQHEVLRMNLLNRLLDSIEQIDPTENFDTQGATLAEVVAYNTLVRYGFLVNV